VRLGAQNLMWLDAGAFTGEISAPMLKDVGCVLVEIGHSERRRLFTETDERVNAKVRAALRCGLDALVRVGDTLDERAAGAAADAVLRQARMAFTDIARADQRRCKIAYEPVWAIGEGGTAASPEEAAVIHALLKDAFPDIPVIYGGSIDETNAAALAARPEIDGLFVGRAALDPANFIAIHARARAARGTRT
jgi:triosephosphate isomerase